MRKKYKTWIQQLSESYIRNTLRENAPSADMSMLPVADASQVPDQVGPSGQYGDNQYGGNQGSYTMSAAPNEDTPTPNNGPNLGKITQKKNKITNPAPGYEHEENGVVYTYYIGPPAFLVITQNGQSVTYFWGQNGWYTN